MRERWIGALAGVAACGILACAHILPPPGGPIRRVPPHVIGTFPDTITPLPDFKGRAVFLFDEVINEGTQPNFGYGTGSLEQLVMLSPDTAVPSVAWERNRITVRPKHGWQPNTVYRIELLPGVTDLQLNPNTMKTGRVITFTTGGPLPTRFLRGRAIDWSAKAGVPLALIVAYHLPDSSGYRTYTDSAGRFRFGPLPAGPYLVTAIVDQDRNHKLSAKEAWDTVRIAAGRDSVGEIWTFARDTAKPVAQDIARLDSTGITITFSLPIDPYQMIPADSIRVLLLPDSGNVGPRFARPKALDDSLTRLLKPRTAKDDSIARLDSLTRDSTAKAAALAAELSGVPLPPPPDLPREKRPDLGPALVVRTTGQIRPGHRYFVEVRGVRMAGGAVGTIDRVLDVPEQKVDTNAVRADSMRQHAKQDSVRADSLRKRVPPDSVHADSLMAAARALFHDADSVAKKSPAKPAKDTSGAPGAGRPVKKP